MSQQPSAVLDTIQIRYDLSYLTYLRMKSWAQSRSVSMRLACNTLLNNALDEHGVTRDPAVLLGVRQPEEKPA